MALKLIKYCAPAASWRFLGSKRHLRAVSGPILAPILAPFLGPSRPRAVPNFFFRLLRPPRALQEALQRLSEGLRVEDAIWNQFWTGLGSDVGDPGL